MIKYYKLFDILNRSHMKKTDLLEIMSTHTLAKISKGENINTDVINKICSYLNCQPGDIMEYVEDNPQKPNFIQALKANYKAGYNYMTNKPEDEFRTTPFKNVKKTSTEVAKQIDKARKYGTTQDLEEIVHQFDKTQD